MRGVNNPLSWPDSVAVIATISMLIWWLLLYACFRFA